MRNPLKTQLKVQSDAQAGTHLSEPVLPALSGPTGATPTDAWLLLVTGADGDTSRTGGLTAPPAAILQSYDPSAALSDRKRLARPPPPPSPPLHWGCPSLKAIHRLWDQDSAERASPPAPAVRGGGGPAAGSGSVSGSSRRGRSGGSRSPGVWEVMGALRARAARGLAPAPMGISGEPSEEVGDEEKDEEQGSRGRLSVGGGGEGRSATDRRRVEQSEV